MEEVVRPSRRNTASVTLPTGAIVNQMKIYRVQNGLITHDWTAFER